MGNKRSDKSYPLLLLTIVTLTDETRVEYTLESAMKETLDTYINGHEAASAAPIEQGLINGCQFARATWEGKVKATAQNGMAGRTMHGIIYVTFEDHKIVQIICMDAEPHHLDIIKDANLAATTFRVSQTP